MKRTIEINVIMSDDFTNYFLFEAIQNINKVINYTHNNSELEVINTNFVIGKKGKDKFFNLKDIPFKYKRIDVTDEKISDVFNNLPKTSADYVAFYGANLKWYENHLIDGIKQIELYKTKWNVTPIELKESLTLSKPEDEKLISILLKDEGIVDHLFQGILVGEIILKGNELKKINFNRGIIKELTKEYFQIGYALNAELGKYSISPNCTVTYYMNVKEEVNLDYVDLDTYSFDEKLIKETDKDKIVFSVIVNCYNIRNQSNFISILENLKAQKLPQDNFEVLFVANYNSFQLYFPEDKLKEFFKNYKLLYVPNYKETDDSELDSIVYKVGLEQSKGEYICYLNINERFIYTPAYLSELYLAYANNPKLNWTISNYFDIVNYMPRHSNIVVPNREQLYYTLFSHKKSIASNYINIKSIDKNFNNNKLSLVNTLSEMQTKGHYGEVISKSLIQKI